MRAALPQREPGRLAHWESMGLYAAIQKRRKDSPAFVLHDGPPFTNGDVHIGTALNKTLKELILRYKSMRGFRTPYVPGWDCHGLPIEQKVSREVQEQKLELTTSELRARCDAFSEGWIAKQTAQFKRIGILADWVSEYKTKNPAFEADILRTFARFADKGLVYRSKKPVYWSIPFATALAEAEIEYKDHISPSIWVKFRVPTGEAEKFGLPADKPLSVVIWTTTPWTIPANLAIAVHPEVEYAVADLGSERIVVAQALLGQVATAAKLDPAPTVVQVITGKKLEHLHPRHPFIDRASPVVLADYVTTETGTGCVHTAPGHGAEDYLTGLKYKLEIYCPVGDDGRYLDDGRVPAELVGLTALETVEDLEKKRTSPANIGVLKLLDAAGALLAKQRYTHSYPHCWRSKTPIIFRAVDQWFVALDQGGTRSQALQAIGDVKWIPEWGQARIRGAVESRPDWCVSRQRSWGVPIPAFYDADKKGYLDAGVIRAIADKIERRGSNFWYDATPAQILEGVTLPTGWPAPAALSCGRDTLDVWIDSGSSHAAVLRKGQGGTSCPADLYLEGSDQHRGWFQSSLWTSIIAFDDAPYRAVLTHGIIVDTERKKISKSSSYEKQQTSDAYIGEYGADVIRLDRLAGFSGRHSDLPGDPLPRRRDLPADPQHAALPDLESLRFRAGARRRCRSPGWIRWTAGRCTRPPSWSRRSPRPTRTTNSTGSTSSATSSAPSSLSATYHDILKDRLYTLGANAPLRRSAQTALSHIFHVLAKLLAPILAFTTDEAWAFATARTEYTKDSVHLQDWPVAPQDWTDAALEADMTLLFQTRTRVNEAIEPLRAAGQLGKSLDAAVAPSWPERRTRRAPPWPATGISWPNSSSSPRSPWMRPRPEAIRSPFGSARPRNWAPSAAPAAGAGCRPWRQAETLRMFALR